MKDCSTALLSGFNWFLWNAVQLDQKTLREDVQLLSPAHWWEFSSQVSSPGHLCPAQLRLAKSHVLAPWPAQETQPLWPYSSNPGSFLPLVHCYWVLPFRAQLNTKRSTSWSNPLQKQCTRSGVDTKGYRGLETFTQAWHRNFKRHQAPILVSVWRDSCPQPHYSIGPIQNFSNPNCSTSS